MRQTIGDIFGKTVERRSERTFLQSADRRISFADAFATVETIGAALRRSGLGRGSRLALMLPNSPEWAMIFLACARAGIMTITINTRSKPDEIGYILAKSRADALVMVDRFWDIDYRALLGALVPSASSGSPGSSPPSAPPALRHVFVLEGDKADLGLADWLAAQAQHGAAATAPGVSQQGDAILTVFTSGTTGLPKGAMHSHVIMANVANVARAMHIEEGDVILGHMPFYHVAGLCTALLPSILLGCTLVTMAHWQPRAAAQSIAANRVTIFGGIPTHFIDLVDVVEKDGIDTSCLKTAWIGGAAISPEIAKRARTVLGLSALQAAYGMTETSACTTMSGFDDPVEIVGEGKGPPIGDFEVQVADPCTGAMLPEGQNGEVLVRGHVVMLGYIEDDEETRRVLRPDGWFRTGDLGAFDAQGYLRITGRLKDMFIVGGNNVYPAELEHWIHRLPGVRLAAVIGVPDDRLGEVGFAFVERDDGPPITREAVLAYLKEHLADYKVPRHLTFVDQLPMTTTRKIQRHLLVALASDILASPASS
jgi:fatty-acyl-CoA synthase